MCSPAAKTSQPVADAVEAFDAAGASKRVLVLLAEGSPATSFPDVLSGREPLAADVRPDVDSSRRYRERQAALRLVAPMLGCSFDDLRRRDVERRQRRATTLTAVGLVVSLLLGGLSAYALQQADAANTARADLTTMRTMTEGVVGFVREDLYDKLADLGRTDVLGPSLEAELEFYRGVESVDVETERNVAVAGARYADALRRSGERGRALEVLRGVLAQWQALRGRTADDVDVDEWLLLVRRDIAFVLIREGRIAEARQTLEDTFELSGRIDAARGRRTTTVASMVLEIATGYADAGDLDEAWSQCERARALLDQIEREDGQTYHAVLRVRAWALNLQGVLKQESREFEVAERLLQQGLILGRQLSVLDPLDIVLVADALSDIAVLRVGLDRTAEAIPLFEESLVLYRRRAALDPTNESLLRTIAEAGRALGFALLEVGRLDDAERVCSESVSIFRRLAAVDHDSVLIIDTAALAAAQLSRVQAARGSPEAALETASEFLPRLLELAGESDNLTTQQSLATAIDQYAECLVAMGRDEEAVVWLARAIEIGEAFVRRSPGDADGRDQLVELYAVNTRALARLGRHDEAEASALRAAEIQIEGFEFVAEGDDK